MSEWACVLCEATLRGTAVIRSTTEPDICTYCEHELRRRGKRYCRSGQHATADFLTPAYRTCRTCINARRRARYHANPDKRQAQRRAYYVTHTQQECARSKRWRHRHREQARAAERRRYHIRPDVKAHKLLNARLWRQRNPERVRGHYQKSRLGRKLRVLRQIRNTTQGRA